MPLRNVAVSAMEIATLARMFPDRVLPGVGHGVQSWMRQTGARVASPLSLMGEYIPALRALLAGETVSTNGRYVTLEEVALDWPPAVVPRVYAAAEGPKTLSLAGAVADGTVLDSGHTPAEVAASVSALRAAWREADRKGEHDVAAYVVAAFGDRASERAAEVLAGEPDAAERVLAGSVNEVAEAADAFFAAGVDDLVLLPPPDVDLAAFLRDAGELTRAVAARGVRA